MFPTLQGSQWIIQAATKKRRSLLIEILVGLLRVLDAESLKRIYYMYVDLSIGMCYNSDITGGKIAQSLASLSVKQAVWICAQLSHNGYLRYNICVRDSSGWYLSCSGCRHDCHQMDSHLTCHASIQL